MSFCDHCQGQRFDRAQVLRTLRGELRRLRTSRKSAKSAEAEAILSAAIEKVRALDLPHLDPVDDVVDGDVIH